MARSAGILVYRFINQQLEFLLLKPGGPFYKNKENGIWTIPKGEIKLSESEKDAALREFKEETGFYAQENEIKLLDVFNLRKGKQLTVYTLYNDLNVNELKSNTFEIEYPKNSGKKHVFPEIEKGEWMPIALASLKIFPNQLPILDRAISDLKIK